MHMLRFGAILLVIPAFAADYLGKLSYSEKAVAVMAVVPGYLIYYVVQPLPGLLIVKQVGFDLVRMAGLGMCVGWAYR